MPQSEAEKRAYQRGYNRGRERAWRAYRRVTEIAVGWRRKAVEGYGNARCDGCAFWARGFDSAKWGVCSQDCNASPDIGWIWTETRKGAEHARLISHENAFCSNWLPIRAVALKERGNG